MLNTTLILKVRQALNKLSSNDYSNIDSWMILNAFNTVQPLWTRRNLRGTNQKQEGDEQSTSRIDDFEMLLTPTPKLAMNNRQTFFETVLPIPSDYLRYKRISATATNDCCEEPRPLVVYIGEEGNVDILLRDVSKKPSFQYAETFATFIDRKIRIYTNGEFDVDDVYLTYYRQPRRVQMTGVRDTYTGLIPTVDVTCEFNEDTIEVLIKEMAAELAGDIESQLQYQLNSTQAQQDN